VPEFVQSCFKRRPIRCVSRPVGCGIFGERGAVDTSRQHETHLTDSDDSDRVGRLAARHSPSYQYSDGGVDWWRIRR